MCQAGDPSNVRSHSRGQMVPAKLAHRRPFERASTLVAGYDDDRQLVPRGPWSTSRTILQRPQRIEPQCRVFRFGQVTQPWNAAL